jgi:hypothetical protein
VWFYVQLQLCQCLFISLQSLGVIILTGWTEWSAWYQVVLLSVGKLKNTFCNTFLKPGSFHVASTASPPRFVSLLTESVSQILCERSVDIVSSDESIHDDND